MPEPTRDLLDTSVVIDHDILESDLLPDESAISAVTLAEPLQWAAATWDALPFDAQAARIYGRMFAANRAAKQSSRARPADLLIAATAAANDLPLYTRNAADFSALKRIVKVVAL